MKGAVEWDSTYRNGRYRSCWELGFASPELAGYLAARPPGGGRIAIDLGCGSGHDAILLARAGYCTCGLDISAAALEIATANAACAGVAVEWCHADVLEAPQEAGSVDLLADRGCMHHLDGAERRAYAQQVGRLLRPGGELVLRGCAVERFPFVPITPEAIADCFPADAFAAGPLTPLALVTDAGPVEGVACVVRRR